MAERLANAHTVLPVEEAVSLVAEGLTEWLDGDLHIILDECEQLSILPKAADTIRLLQAAMPTSVHLVLITREEPALSLARLRLRGEVPEIHEDALRFDFAQTRELVDQRTPSRLADDEAETLLRLTDGWPSSS